MITAKSLFSEEELMNGIKLHLRCKAYFFLLIMPIFAGISLVLGISYAVLEKEFYLPPFFLAIIFLILPFVITWGIKRNLKKLPLLGKEISWSFDQEGLSGKGEGFEFHTTWAYMYEALLTSQGFLIYPQKSLFYWIPKTAFEEFSAFEEAGRFVKQGIKRTREKHITKITSITKFTIFFLAVIFWAAILTYVFFDERGKTKNGLPEMTDEISGPDSPLTLSPHISTSYPMVAGLELSIDKACGSTYGEGERIRVQFRSDTDGYVTIADIDTQGKFSVLFPNKAIQDNYIKAQTALTIPSGSYAYDFVVTGPSGTETVYAFFSPDSEYHWTYPHIDQRKVQEFITNFSERATGDYAVVKCEFTVNSKTPQRTIITIPNRILFESNSSNLNDASCKDLDSVVEILQRYPEVFVTLSGHTDNIGSSNDKQLLSEKRAMTVANYLISKGISSTRISTIGYGDTQPIVSKETENEPQRNNRVELDLRVNPEQYR